MLHLLGLHKLAKLLRLLSLHKIKNLKSIVEIQAQHRPDRLKKPRTGSVGTDRIRRFCAENRDDASKDIPLGIYFGVSVGALNEH